MTDKSSGRPEPGRVSRRRDFAVPPPEFELHADIEGVPSAEQRAALAQVYAMRSDVVMTAETNFRTGPLPDPAELAEYERIYPGAAKRIFDEAEKDASHFRDMERQSVRITRWDVVLRRLLPFFLVALLLISSTLMALFANPTIGLVAFAGTLAAVVTAYLRRPSDAEEDAEEDEPP